MQYRNAVFANERFIERMIDAGRAVRTEDGPHYAETNRGTPIVNQSERL